MQALAQTDLPALQRNLYGVATSNSFLNNFSFDFRSTRSKNTAFQEIQAVIDHPGSRHLLARRFGDGDKERQHHPHLTASSGAMVCRVSLFRSHSSGAPPAFSPALGDR